MQKLHTEEPEQRY